jgi:hypothetical protein
LIGDLYGVNILPQEASREVVAKERSYEAQNSQGGTTHQAGHTTSAHLALERRLVSVLLCKRTHFLQAHRNYGKVQQEFQCTFMPSTATSRGSGGFYLHH